MNSQKIGRRSLIQGAAASAFAFSYVPQRVWGANERVRLGCIGIGGKGAGDVADLAAAGADIVALCDVDDNRRGGVDQHLASPQGVRETSANQ